MYFIDGKNETPKYPNINCKTFFVKLDSENKNELLFHNHNHIVLEILAVKRGAMHLVTENEDCILKSGEVAVINPLCLHFGEIYGDFCEYICVTVNIKPWFSLSGSEFIKTAGRILEEKYRFKELYGKENPIFSLMLSIEEKFEKEDLSSKCKVIENMYSVFGVLFDDFYEVTEKHTDTRNAQFMKNVTLYIQNHYKENISTNDIAKEFYMTVPCFCYAFKHNLGTSFIKYLSDFRINKAIELASQKDYSLSSLAEEVGFSDYNYFSRTFKNITGVSPTNYFGKRRIK